jgi:hypothetical protein
VGDFQTSIQLHDFNPGIEPSGLFWTIPFDDDVFHARPRKGTARFHVRRLAIPDFGDFGNSVSPNPTSVPGHVRFDMRWLGGGARSHISDAAFGFAGTYVAGDIHVDFSARDDGTGVVYRSDPDGQVTVGGGVGRERNGVFFDRSEDEHARRRTRRRAPRYHRFQRS